MWKFHQKLKINTFQFGKHNLAGFTLLEGMVALLILSCILLLANTVIKSTVAIEVGAGKNSQVEWHLFLNQFEHISTEWQLKKVEPEKLTFREGNKLVELSFYKNLLRIRKNGGYEPVLTRVIKTRFSDNEGGVDFKIKLEDGKEYCATFYGWGRQ
ncbi:ComGF family competence protein [Vagococcus coleopterorum]|uniref:ComGF family competence protein n=1 Tax=Vagococcus coleopterorum TaxID=2714946 RepID=A0A6G8ALE7_9ENTE|nr:ComGF family competence protein [Vagococcus coleopterorum]